MHRLIFDHLDSRFPSSRPVVYQALTQAKENITPQQLINNVSFVDVAAYEGPLEQDVAAIERPIGRAYGFSAREKGVNSMINGAQGATGSGYFAYCFAEHIPEDVDLVIIEQAINDERYVMTVLDMQEKDVGSSDTQQCLDNRHVRDHDSSVDGPAQRPGHHHHRVSFKVPHPCSQIELTHRTYALMFQQMAMGGDMVRAYNPLRDKQRRQG